MYLLSLLAAGLLACSLQPGGAAPQTGLHAAGMEEQSYEDHQVLRVIPMSADQVGQLRLFLADRPTLDVWLDPSQPGQPVDVMVGPGQRQDVEDFLTKIGLKAMDFIPDVAGMIVEGRKEMEDSKRDNGFGWNTYYTLDEINNWLKSKANQSEYVSLIEAGKSYEGRKILGVKIKFQENAPIIFIEAGIHAREWITPAAATYLIDQIVKSGDEGYPLGSEVYRSYEWHIFPSTNPDGYHYTHTANRLWRKTRSKYNYYCYGADPNRNWPFRWKEVGASSFPCSDTYAGIQAESEPETKGLRQYLDSVIATSRLKVYLSIHSYSQLILYPWGYTSQKPKNDKELDRVAAAAAKGFKDVNGLDFRYGPISTTIYPAAGSTVDYAYAKGVTYAYAFELRDTGRYGFLLPPNQIYPAANETAVAIAAIASEVMGPTGPST